MSEFERKRGMDMDMEISFQKIWLLELKGEKQRSPSAPGNPITYGSIFVNRRFFVQ
jgi:hypothetical protein